jgi:hypothetical protein
MTETPKWSDLWGIDPTYDEDRIEEPTFTASELKERLETATAVALALGRKEAANKLYQLHKPLPNTTWCPECHTNFPCATAQACLDLSSQGHLAAANGLTVAPASPSTPKESVPAESAFPDLPEGSDQ